MGAEGRERVRRVRAKGAAMVLTAGRWAGLTIGKAEAAVATWIRSQRKRNNGAQVNDLSTTQQPLLIPHSPHQSSTCCHPLGPPWPLSIAVVDAAPVCSSQMLRNATLDRPGTPWLKVYATAPKVPAHPWEQRAQMAMWGIDSGEGDAKGRLLKKQKRVHKNKRWDAVEEWEWRHTSGSVNSNFDKETS